MEKKDFEKLVTEAFRELPNWVLEKLKNVAIVIEDYPSDFQLKNLESSNKFLLGLYEGVPQIERKYYNRALPDKITLFYKNFEKECGDNLKILKRKIKEVLKHEIAHHFGFKEEEIQNKESP
jgi:predicted Zn-dependent protease with MMP-like domain